jgi:putative ABC transport system substrate-binding protein
MRRREFITLLGCMFVMWPLDVSAQQPAMPVVGFLTGATREGFEPYVTAFRDGLQKAGFVTGRNLQSNTVMQTITMIVSRRLQPS